MAKHEQVIRGCFWSVIIGVIVLASIPPVPDTLPGRKSIKDLSNAKQVYLGLKMYAGDHDGEFPSSLPDGSPVTTSNQAFRVLVPEYIQKETIFYAEGSAWTSKEPDNEIVGERKLAAGENAFAYISNLRDDSNPSFPLVMTGFLEGRPGVYGDDSALKGKILKGYGVAFVCVEGSGRLLRLKRKAPSGSAPESRLLEDDPGAFKDRQPTRKERSLDWSRVTVEYEDGSGFLVKERGKDLFKPAPDWLAPNQVPLNPE